MIIYCASYWNANGHYQEWFKSNREANEAVYQWQRDDSIHSTFDPQRFEVPTDKAGLVDWLNMMCNNGESSIS